jgi:protocatechuate 3,4-dioxygenase beta subunit
MSNSAVVSRRKVFGLGAGAALGGAMGMLAKPAFAAPNANQQGVSGGWFNPATSGQGLMIEVYPDLTRPGVGLLFGGWFTYDQSVAGGQRWYSISGEVIDGNASVAVKIYRNVGGLFDAPPVTFSTIVGDGEIRFDSCEAGAFSYRFTDGATGSMPLRRLLPNVACANTGTGLADTEFALSGSWYDPEISGQGLMLEVNPSLGFAFATWYTYGNSASAGPAGQRWLTGQGSYTPGARRLAIDLFNSSGGALNQSDIVSTQKVGTLVITFSSCDAASASYSITSGEFAGRADTILLRRTGPAPGSCAFASTCALVPSETEGPYPLASVLSDPAIIRRDITEGRPGVPLTLILKLVNINQSCAPVPDRAVYIWQTDKDGVYSGYNQPGANAIGQKFMRGVQKSDRSGQAIFQTIYPGWYSGRITHIHFRVYLADSPSGGASVTSQIAFPPEVTTAVYASPLYLSKGQNTSVASFAADNVFRDGTSLQLAKLSGSPSTGYVATLIVGIAM